MLTKPAPRILPVRTPVEDLRRSAADMSRDQLKKLVMAYWRAQRARVATKWSMRDIDHPLLEFFAKSFTRIENQIRRSFEIYVDQYTVGRWAISHPGIGAYCSAGLLAFVDMDKCKDNIGALWRYAGLDPTSRWLTRREIDNWLDITRSLYGETPGEDHINKICSVFHFNKEIFTERAVRWGRGEVTWRSLRSAMAVIPWNRNLKEVCYHIGMGIRYNSGNPNYLYGQLYTLRREYEHKQNAIYAYEDQALKEYRKRFWRSEEAGSPGYLYKNGILPPGHIEARARRWAVKIMLTHWHQIYYYSIHGKMPKQPHILTAMPEAGEIICPNWPFKS